MVAERITSFGGMIPATDPRLLPTEVASYAVNCWLYNGKLVPLRSPKPLHENALLTTGKVFRIPADYSNSTYLYDSTWMEFQDPFTDVIHAPVFNDSFDRYYWTSSSDVPQYNTKARIVNGDDPYLLGIPRPGTPTFSSITGGSGTNVSRAYVVTFVSAYGEEGPPSLAVLGTGFPNGTWTLNVPQPNADDINGPDRDIDEIYIYRTITSSLGVATYFYVDSVPVGTTTYADTNLDTAISANEQLLSDSWTAPPSDLQGFVMMPNGVLASWRNNEVWFSEPYRPHAWPVEYVLTVEYPIVGLGVVGQNLVVCTAGYPVIIYGAHPATMSQSTLTSFEPCTGRGSIISAPEGVYYASPNGLILVNTGGAENITREIVTKDRWEDLTNGARFRAARMGTAYFGFGSVQPGVFSEDSEAFQDDTFTFDDFTGAYNGIIVDPINKRAGFSLLNVEEAIYGVQTDVWSGEVFVLAAGYVFWINQGFDDEGYYVGLWRSKTFESLEPMNFGAIKVSFELHDAAPTLNPTRQTVPPTSGVDADRYGYIRLYADGSLVMNRELRKSGELFRPPSGFKASEWYFEIETRIKITAVQIASTSKELASV